MRKKNFYKKTPFSFMLLQCRSYCLKKEGKKCNSLSFSKEEEECINLFLEHGYTPDFYNRKLKNYLEARNKTLNAPKGSSSFLKEKAESMSLLSNNGYALDNNRKKHAAAFEGKKKI